ncbi:DUF2254 domain-containing protein, partial [Citreimonas salinaria]
PQDLPVDIPESATQTILTIVATSMLTVATFALATMVTAFFGASQTTTPRVVRLISQDRAAQAPISIFIGAFMFSIVGIIALSSGFFTASGRLILFSVTLLVVILVVGALIRWISKISSIGQVGETIQRMELTTSAAFREIAERPLFGCRQSTRAADHGRPLHATRLGFVQNIETGRLQKVAETHDLFIHVVARPGAYVTAARPLVLVSGTIDEDAVNGIREAIVLGRERTFDHDPRFGLIVLNEIAARALSTGVNDPGTAINVIQTDVRILSEWFARMEQTHPEPGHDRVSMVAISPQDILDDAFRPIARDGAGTIEVCVKLFEALETIQVVAPDGFRAPVDRFAEELMERARAAMSHPADIEVVEQAASRVTGGGGAQQR